MATGALDANGVYLYGEDDSEATFSALLNKLGTSIGTNMKGRILQIVTGETGTIASNSTSTYADTGLTATITPTRATSKIMVIANQSGLSKSAGNSQSAVNIRLNVRNAAVLKQFAFAAGYTNSSTDGNQASASFTYVDTPGSIAAFTYKTQFANFANAASVTVQAGSSVSSIMLVEVAA